MSIKSTLLILAVAVTSNLVLAGDYTYKKIAERHVSTALSEKQIAAAKMQGECLVGLKELNFKKKEDFDPVAEWTSFRSSALLKQVAPCEVLIMMEVAQTKLRVNG